MRYTSLTLNAPLSTRDLSTILLTIVLVIVYFLPVDFLFNNPHTFCLHKKLLHFDCPACGMTRALYSVLHGQFKQAFSYNIGVFPLSILILQHYFSYLKQSKFLDNLQKYTIRLLIVVMLTQYIFKAIQHFS